MWESVKAFPKFTPVFVTWNSTPLVVTAKPPVTFKLPVKVCVLETNDPKFVDPVIAEILDLQR